MRHLHKPEGYENMPFGIVKKNDDENDDEIPSKDQLIRELIVLIHDLKEIWEMSGFIKAMCPICQKPNIILLRHHVSYYPERILYVCKSCHTRIHHDKKFYPELCPPEGDSFRFYDKKPEETTLCPQISSEK